MVRAPKSRASLRLAVAAAAAVGCVASMASGIGADAAPASGKLAKNVSTSKLPKSAKPGGTAPQGLPRKGSFAFLLQLQTKSTSSVYATTKRTKGTASARSAARSQLASVRAAQNRVIADLPSKTSVLYRTHAATAGVAVVTDVKNFAALRAISGVTAVHPIAPKTISNSYAVPYQGGRDAWQTYGDLGQDSTIAIIDTGVDYTHANLGGPVGTVAAYDTAKDNDTTVPASDSYDHSKFNATTLDVNGNPAYMYDFAGDDYQADPNSAGYQPVPHPDPNPLDCNSHGSHVAGTAAGFGEDADGDTYRGSYGDDTPFDEMRIGPGVAPKARIYAYKVFGCAGSTNVTGEAIDKAMDPNGDGDTSDHADVVNMSLGSDYGFPDDGDSVLTNEASEIAGVTMVVASGNGGDIYDIGGSPGNAVRSIAVANSQDASSKVDALHVTLNGAPNDYAALRSVAYDWVNDPDLSGDVARLTQPGNLDGCSTITGQYADEIAGKIAFVEWDSNDVTRRCGSAGRAGKLAAAGAIGFIFGDDEENFSAGITGSATIPGVLVAKSGADAIRSALVAGQPVKVTGTTLGGYDQFDLSLNDTVNDSSSRGIRDAGNVKPDVTAIGTSVWSTGMGTGNQGLNDTGTSMATPMVAGTAALVKSKHPNWTPEQVKADIMNTADADLYRDPDYSGPKYGPNRVGAGRIDIKAALDNSVLAYTTDGEGGTSTGAVSASWGPLALPVNGGTWTGSKTIKLTNTGQDAESYAVSFDDRTTIPGATYSVSTDTVTVEPHQSASIKLTLTIDPTLLTKTIDPTASRVTALPRQYVADASGLVIFKNDNEDRTDLRVPAYAAPRPASDMTQPGSLTLPSGPSAKALLPLSGDQVSQGTGAAAIQSLVAGFELQAKSGLVEKCTSPDAAGGCWDIPDERAADVQYVGATSDAPQWNAIGRNPLEGEAYFAISTHFPYRHPVSPLSFQVYIDTSGDGVADYVLYTTRVAASTLDTDVMVTALYDVATQETTLEDGINASLGDTDTAVFDSDTLVLPVLLSDLGITADKSRITYGVVTYDGYHSAPVDVVGGVNDATNEINGGLSFDVLHPGVSVQGSFNGSGSPLLFEDSPGSVLALTRNLAAYQQDKAEGALIVHFHNQVGEKAQVVDLNQQASTVALDLSPNPATVGQQVTAKVTVGGVDGITPTGTVTLKQGDTTVDTAPVGDDGTATFHFTPDAIGSYQYTATYSGDSAYASGASDTETLKVDGADATVTLGLAPNPVAAGNAVTATVNVSGAHGDATGTVTLQRVGGDAGTVGSAPLTNGSATISFTPDTSGSYQYKATYSGDSVYAGGSSGTEDLTVNAAEATVSLGLAPNPVTVGKPVTATITVSGGNGGATGTVTLHRLGSNAGTVGSATLTNGSATIKFTPSATGTTQYQATYSGDSHYGSGESSAQNLVVNPKAKPSVSLSFKPAKVKGGTPTTITVKVTGTAGTATGTVTVRRLDGAGAPSVFKARRLSNGSVSFSYTPGRAKGTFHYQVTYSGDANYASATSAKVALTVT